MNMENVNMKCEVCNKIFLNQNELIVHFESYYHQQREKTQKAIFIHCVSCDISVDEVIKTISQFGPIRKYDVIMHDGFNDLTIEFKNK